MGIIKAITGAIGGGLADQWLEVFEAEEMGEGTIFSRGVSVRRNDKRNQNVKGSTNVVNNGSVIHVAQNQFMLLVDGGKVIDYSAEPGYYKVDNTTSPSLFNGDFGDALKETFNRIRFGGVTPNAQQVFFINLQEIKNIPFGTVNPVNYFDQFYQSELFLRAHGYYSIRVVEPLKFFAEAVPRNAQSLDIRALNRQYVSEFLTALQSALNQMSVDGIRVSFVTAKTQELSKYMASCLDDEWRDRRGMVVESVGITSVSYDEESKKLINMRNQGAMLSDPAVREGYVQGAMARGVEAAGSNSAGAMTGFMGVGMGMQNAGGAVSAMSASNQAQMQRQTPLSAPQETAPGWNCACGNASNAGAFCSACGVKKPEAPQSWQCACGNQNQTQFCPNCGAKKQTSACTQCGMSLDAHHKFCPQCGQKR